MTSLLVKVFVIMFLMSDMASSDNGQFDTTNTTTNNNNNNNNNNKKKKNMEMRATSVISNGVQLPMHFVEHPQSVVALPGDSVFFNCRANDEQHTQLQWTLNGQGLTPDDLLLKINKDELVVEVSLDARQRRSQLGAYQCLAKGNGTSIVSLPAQLHIAHIEEFRADRNHSVEVFEGNDAVIACRAPSSIPEAIVQFYKDGQLLDLGYGQEGGRRRLLNTDLLFIANVTSASDAGVYTCSATNHMTNEVKFSLSTTTLLVQAAPDRHYRARLTFWPKEEYRVAEHEDLVVPCVASGHPRPHVVWSRLGDDEQRGVDQNDGLLVIKKADEKVVGHYMCTVFNGGRRFVRRTSITLLRAPSFDSSLVSIEAAKGEAKLLHCEAQGQPDPKKQWFFNGQVVDAADQGLLANHSLLIANINHRDGGVYQCIAVNSVGRAAIVFDLLVNDEDEDEDRDWSNLRMVAPSRPILRQLGAHSVLLTWTQSTSASSMPVQFFKVQFREFWPSLKSQSGGKRRSEWRTMDETINARARSFEVLGLKERIRYRFRVVAVFVNDDNLHSSLSRRFKLDTRSFEEKEPNQAPVITQVLPLGPRALRVGWKMDSLAKADVEGYFILIRMLNSNAQQSPEWRRITIMGATSHSYIFDELQPSTRYEVRVQAFNFAGNSPHSKAFKQWTLAQTSSSTSRSSIPLSSSSSSSDLSNSSLSNSNLLSSNSSVSTSSHRLSDDEVTLSLILGGALAGVVLVLILYCSILNCMQRRRARKALASDNAVIIHEKYSDTARSISRGHVGLDNNNNGGNNSSSSNNNVDLESMGGVYETSSMSLLAPANSVPVSMGSSSSNTNTTAETSFSAVPNIRPRSRMDNNLREVLGTSRRLEEYETEPTRNTWKRRRKSEILV